MNKGLRCLPELLPSIVTLGLIASECTVADEGPQAGRASVTARLPEEAHHHGARPTARSRFHKARGPKRGAQVPTGPLGNKCKNIKTRGSKQVPRSSRGCQGVLCQCGGGGSVYAQDCSQEGFRQAWAHGLGCGQQAC